jgi:alginate O-acetyltransferase complex protein AlgJ
MIERRASQLANSPQRSGAKAAVWSFIGITLLLVLSLPVINLRSEPARAYAQRLIKQKNTDRLVRLLFNGDFLEAELSRVLWKTGLSINPEKVVVGERRWLYLGDGYDLNTSAQGFGESDRDALMGQAMGRTLMDWDRWLKAQGVKGFVLVVGPDKHRIYRRHLPQWVDLQRPPRIRTLLSSGAGHLIADPTAELIRRSEDDRVHTYYRSDTHWNMWGAALSLESLRQTLERQGVALSWAMPQPPAIDHTGTRIGGDLASFLRIQHTVREQEPHPLILNREAIRSDIRELGTGRPLPAGDFGQVQYPGHTVRVVTEGAANSLKVLWLRDSFGIAQSPMMAANFRETIQLHWGRALADQARLFVELVQDERPDLVVMTVVERVMPEALFLTPPPQD